jgi:hypothetical protein
MSYDLMVFETGAAPKEHKGFIEWYFRQTKWSEGHSYNDPGVASARLQAWFSDMILAFPPLNGPLAKEELPDDEGTASDYSIGRQFIYIGFAWSKAEAAYQAVVSLAAKHQLGFFDVSSSEEEVWLPGKSSLTLAHKKNPPTLLGRIKRLLSIGIK